MHKGTHLNVNANRGRLSLQCDCECGGDCPGVYAGLCVCVNVRQDKGDKDTQYRKKER